MLVTFAQVSRAVASAWKWLLVALLVGAALGYGAGRALKSSWSSNAAVVVSSATNDGSASLLARVPSYAQLVTSERVLRPLEQRFGEPDLSSSITGTYGDGTYIVMIGATDADQHRAQEMAQAAADSYVAQLNGGFGGAIAPFQAVHASVVQRAAAAAPASKVSPRLMIPVGAVLLPAVVLLFALLRERRRSGGNGGDAAAAESGVTTGSVAGVAR